MPRRIPRPDAPTRVRLELSADELRAVEDAAHACRLSVASFARVVMIDAAANPRTEEWRAVAERLMAGDKPAPKRKRK